jgi:ribosomal protein S27AE
MNIWKDFIRRVRIIAPIRVDEKTCKTTKGMICPRCNNFLMEYDGQLNLHCKKCGYFIAGSYT